MDQFNELKFFADLKESLPAAFIQYTLYSDGTDNTIYLSQWCEGLWELSIEEIKNNSDLLWEVVHPDDKQKLKFSIEKSAQNLSYWEHQWRLLTKSGKEKWVVGRGIPHQNRDDKSITWNTVILEITQQHILDIELQSKITQISHILKNNIYSLGKALELRDQYTMQHQRNVASYARAIAKSLGLNNEQILGVELGSLVHDIGKIAIPIEILNKPSMFNEAERLIMNLHPEHGTKIFEEDIYPWPIHEIILQHHERLDGSGYPFGLKDEDILLEAKIVAVADVFESMSANRPYRISPGVKAALDELEKHKGVKYHIQSVDALHELVKNNQINLENTLP